MNDDLVTIGVFVLTVAAGLPFVLWFFDWRLKRLFDREG